MKLHNELPPKYGELMKVLKGKQILGIRITDSLVLEGLAIIAWNIAKHHNPHEAVRRIESLILGNLSGIWTFKLINHPKFPYFSHIEAERWFLGHLNSQHEACESEDWEYLRAPRMCGRYSFEKVLTLETQLGARIGKCSTYSITLGIILCACELVDDLELVGSDGHVWVYCQVKGENEYRHIDLSLRSHGELEEDKDPGYYKRLLIKECALRYNLLDL